jgi:para-nitrobenzyl esterase
MSKGQWHAVLAVLCVITLALGIFSGCGTTQTSLNVVKLDSGKISGVQQGGTWTYLGIPYAKPPVGNLRWKPPEAPVAWSGTRACTKYGATCPQPPGQVSYGKTSEDCLYLNVWTPAKASTEKLPVMVWIYGGAFTTGSGSDSRFVGTNLTKQGVIVVTMNYRVGMFGFMAHPQLSKESPHHSSGDYGLMDMIQALKWVKTNINGFGGDPGRVTVFGQSSGAESVQYLLVSPPARGLFQKAISESGPRWHYGWISPMNPTLEDAYKTGEQMAVNLGCDKASDHIAAMRAKSSDEVLKAAGYNVLASDPPTGIQAAVNVDGWIVPEVPEKLFNAGKQMNVPVLIGTNKDDGTLFGAIVQKNNITTAQYPSIIKGAVGDANAAEVVSMFPVTTDAQVGATVSNLLTQMDFASCARYICQSTTTKTRSNAFLYQFTRVPPNKAGALLGCHHSAEIQYVFGNLPSSEGFGPKDTEISNTMMGYWTRFAKTGDPNGGGSTVWPAFSSKDQNLEIGDQVKVNAGLFKAQCDLSVKIYGAGKP